MSLGPRITKRSITLLAIIVVLLPLVALFVFGAAMFVRLLVFEIGLLIGTGLVYVVAPLLPTPVELSPKAFAWIGALMVLLPVAGMLVVVLLAVVGLYEWLPDPLSVSYNLVYGLVSGVVVFGLSKIVR